MPRGSIYHYSVVVVYSDTYSVFVVGKLFSIVEEGICLDWRGLTMKLSWTRFLCVRGVWIEMYRKRGDFVMRILAVL